MSQQIYFIAAVTVVGIGLTILVFFVREGIVTSNIYQKGVALYQQKDYQGAESAFRQVISRHPSNDVARLLLGDVLIQQNKLEEAIALLQELTVVAPKNVDGQLKLGTALIKQNNLKEAIAALEKARDLFKKQRNPQKADKVNQLLQEIATNDFS